MKKIFVACMVSGAAMFAVVSASYADLNDQMKNSKYCMEGGASDPACMGPESMKMRKAMMEMTKEKAMATRTKYCADNGNDDPICDPKMMNDTTGY